MTADYTIFIDEAFFNWFGLRTIESNICYAALSLPTERLENLKQFESAIQRFAKERLPASKVTQNAAELKSTALRYLTAAIIDELGKKIDYFLTKNHGVIFGFFIPAEGFYNYKLRSDYIHDPARLASLQKADYQKRIEEIRQEMLKKWEDGENDLGLIDDIYRTFFGFIVQYHGDHLKKSFRIVYDSRQPNEDARLHGIAESFARLVDRVTPGTFAYYKGYSAASSSGVPGLRLVDWIVGEVRSFFYRNPAIIGGDSELKVLSPCPNPKMILFKGRAPFYRRELSTAAKACFQATGCGSMLPFLKGHFAKGILTYYAQHGEARHISMSELAAYDMAD
jgi:hypothetical protein